MDEMSDEVEDSDMEEAEFNDDDADDDEDLDVDEDGGDDDLQDLDDLELDDIDDDASDIEFNDDDDGDDDDDLDETPSKKRKLNKTDGKFKHKVKGLPQNTFVSSEEFAEMLENQGRSKFKHGASKSLSDRDGASFKQLDWEADRNERISGYRKGKKGGKKPFNNFKSKKPFSKGQKPIKRKR